jgi:hypothetical protein
MPLCSKLGKNNKLIYYDSYNYEKPTKFNLFLDSCICYSNNIDIVNYTLPIVEKQITYPKIVENSEKQNILQNDNKNKIIDYDEDIIISLLKILNASRFNSRNEWYKIGALIYSLNIKNGLELFDELSKQSKYYETIDYIKKNYESIKYKKYSIGSLFYFAKMDNPVEFNKIIKNKIFHEKKLVDIIEINNRYLLNIDDNLNGNNILVKNINNFFTNDSIKSFNLKSPYDTGKTQMLKKIIIKFNPPKILWISYRISLTNDIKFNFNDLNFKSYLDLDYEADRVIIQLESLLKLSNNNKLFIDEDTIEVPSYDLVIIDEIESILAHFNSPTFKNMSNETFKFLEEIIHNSKKLITLDGDTSNRTFSYISHFGNSININNNIKFNQKIYNIINDDNDFKNNIYNNLNKNNKIAIVSQSRRECESLHNIFKNKYPNKNILIYTSLTDDEQKMKLCNVNKEWINADILIYSPTIEAGVNFDIVHFNKIYGILTNGSTSQRAFLQMLARIRKVTDNEILILNDNTFKLNNINEYITYNNCVYAIQDINSFKMTTNYTTINNKRVKTINYDNYTNNYIYNKVEEENKKPFYFLAKLKEIIECKGHIFKFESSKIVDEDYIKPSNELYNEIVVATTITKVKYNILEKKKFEHIASHEEKIQMLKYYYCSLLGLDDLDYNLIKTFYNKKYLIKNFTYLIDKKNLLITNEAQNKIEIEKLDLVYDILNVLGFDNIFDNKKFITCEEFKDNFKKIYNSNKIYKCKKTAKLYFQVPYFIYDENTTNKKILGNLNIILEKYSIKISYKQITNNKMKQNIYYIEILNNIDIILKNKITSGFNLIDNNNIFNKN